MKAMSSLVIALLAIFSAFASARIVPVSFNMVANVSQLSVATAEFKSIGDYDEGGNTCKVSFYLPGHFSDDSVAYKKLDCVTATCIGDSSRFSIKRSFVSRSNDRYDFARLDHNLSFNYGEVAGFFKTACSFIAPETPRASGKLAHANAVLGARDARISEYNTQVRPLLNSAVSSFEVYVSPTYSMHYPSAFYIKGIDRDASLDQVIIRNPHADEATTGTLMNFESFTPQTSCDVYWDGVPYLKSATTEIIENGNGIRFTLGSPLNAATEIVVFCYDIRGIAVAPGFNDDTPKYFPSALEFDYDSRKIYTIASTPSHPISAEFETGFTTHPSSPNIAPKASMFSISPLE